MTSGNACSDSTGGLPVVSGPADAGQAQIAKADGDHDDAGQT